MKKAVSNDSVKIRIRIWIQIRRPFVDSNLIKTVLYLWFCLFFSRSDNITDTVLFLVPDCGRPVGKSHAKNFLRPTEGR